MIGLVDLVDQQDGFDLGFQGLQQRARLQEFFGIEAVAELVELLH